MPTIQMPKLDQISFSWRMPELTRADHKIAARKAGISIRRTDHVARRQEAVDAESMLPQEGSRGNPALIFMTANRLGE